MFVCCFILKIYTYFLMKQNGQIDLTLYHTLKQLYNSPLLELIFIVDDDIATKVSAPSYDPFEVLWSRRVPNQLG